MARGCGGFLLVVAILMKNIHKREREPQGQRKIIGTYNVQQQRCHNIYGRRAASSPLALFHHIFFFVLCGHASALDQFVKILLAFQFTQVVYD